MKIKFNNKQLYGNLVLGLVWAGIGAINYFEADQTRWSNTIYFVLGLTYVGLSISGFVYQYLSIGDGTIHKNKLYGFGGNIHLKDITAIEKKYEKYTLLTPTKKMKINTASIEEESLTELKTILEKLNLAADKTPFAASL